MAEIVVFNRWRQAHARRPEVRIAEQGGPEQGWTARDAAEQDAPQGGKLLMFTGIRYERLDAAGG